jgi:hypothetical protein
MSTTQHSASVSVNHHHLIASHRIPSHRRIGGSDAYACMEWNGIESDPGGVGDRASHSFA